MLTRGGAILGRIAEDGEQLVEPGEPLDAEGLADGDGSEEQEGIFRAALPGLILLALLLAAIVFGIAQLAPDEAPDKRDPSFIDAIFANVVVIAAARALLLIAAVVGLIALVYIGASAAVRLARGEWLQRAGPFQPQLQEVADSLAETDTFLEEWLEATDVNEELTRTLEERDEAIRELLQDREVLLEEVQRLGQKLERGPQT